MNKLYTHLVVPLPIIDCRFEREQVSRIADRILRDSQNISRDLLYQRTAWHGLTLTLPHNLLKSDKPWIVAHILPVNGMRASLGDRAQIVAARDGALSDFAEQVFIVDGSVGSLGAHSGK